MDKKIYTGTQFKSKYPNYQFVKLTNKSEIHHSFKFKSGLNIDAKPFNPTGQCRAGGIYFTNIEYLGMWLEYNKNIMFYCRYVTLPDDAIIYEENKAFKADKLILSDRIEIGSLEVWYDEIFCLKSIENKLYALKYFQIQTPAICLSIISKYPDYLKKVKIQSKDICQMAVGLNGLLLEFVKVQDYDICLIAIKQNAKAIKYINEHFLTKEISLIAVKQDGLLLKYVVEQTYEICQMAVNQYPNAIEYCWPKFMLRIWA